MFRNIIFEEKGNEMYYEIKPILVGTFGPVTDNIKYRNGDPKKQSMVPSYVFYIKSENLNILVDMGFSSIEKCEKLTGLKCKRTDSFENILKSNRIDPAEIDTVICTHLHWDHAGNGKLFRNAKIICQRDELSWALSPPMWEPGYSKDFSKEIVEVVDQIEPVNGNVIIYEDLKVIKLGGHTVGSQAVLVNTIKGEVIIPGDLIMTYRNYKESIPIGLFTNLNECINAIQWLKSKNATVLPGHSWETLNFKG